MRQTTGPKIVRSGFRRCRLLHLNQLWNCAGLEKHFAGRPAYLDRRRRPTDCHDDSDEVAEQCGIAVGPFDRVSETLAALDSAPVDAAIIDGNLRDRTVTPVAQRLQEQGIAFVIYSGTGVPDDLAVSAPHSPLEMKPGRPVERLIEILRGAAEPQAA